MQFSGKSVIITGAGKGIGRACARIMAERGADVIALSRTASDLESLRAEIGARSITVDLGDAKAARAAMAEAGTADFLINSAGINVLESSFDMTDAGYEAVMGINLRAALIACQEFGIARRSRWWRRDRQYYINRRPSRLYGTSLLCRFEGRP